MKKCDFSNIFMNFIISCSQKNLCVHTISMFHWFQVRRPSSHEEQDQASKQAIRFLITRPSKPVRLLTCLVADSAATTCCTGQSEPLNHDKLWRLRQKQKMSYMIRIFCSQLHYTDVIDSKGYSSMASSIWACPVTNNPSF
jgi:hypothetical protein